MYCDYLYGEQVAGPDTAVTDLQFSPAGDLVLVSTEAGEMEALHSGKISHLTQTFPKRYLSRGGAANFGFISITYHQYIFGLYKYILRLEISIFDRENNKNRQELML